MPLCDECGDDERSAQRRRVHSGTQVLCLCDFCHHEIDYGFESRRLLSEVTVPGARRWGGWDDVEPLAA